ncbi:hypothetical protein ACFQX7_01520 [Luedemannella flava]
MDALVRSAPRSPVSQYAKRSGSMSMPPAAASRAGSSARSW